MKVYRIELRYSLLDEQSKKFYNSTNQGPMCNILGNWIYQLNGYRPLNLCTSSEYMPEPDNDGITHCMGWHFGFENLDHLERFFNSDILRLKESGFVVAVYEVPDNKVQLGKNQLCFVLKHSVLIEYHDIRLMLIEHRNKKYGFRQKAVANSTEVCS